MWPRSFSKTFDHRPLRRGCSQYRSAGAAGVQVLLARHHGERWPEENGMGCRHGMEFAGLLS